jgi:hypothetical protein
MSKCQIVFLLISHLLDSIQVSYIYPKDEGTCNILLICSDIIIVYDSYVQHILITDMPHL